MTTDSAPIQLLDGRPVLLPPPSQAHQRVVANLERILCRQLAGWPHCRLFLSAEIVPPHRDTSRYRADLMVSVTDPLLIIEVVDSATETVDRKVKLPDYRRMPNVREILYVDAEAPYCELSHRNDAGRWESEIITCLEDVLWLALCEEMIPVREIYQQAAKN